MKILISKTINVVVLTTLKRILKKYKHDQETGSFKIWEQKEKRVPLILFITNEAIYLSEYSSINKSLDEGMIEYVLVFYSNPIDRLMHKDVIPMSMPVSKQELKKCLANIL